MRVILAEKPDMGRNIAKALGAAKSNRGYIELKNGDIVTWAIGHIIRLKTPDAYPQYQEWNLASLPIIPEPMLYEVDPDKKDQFQVIKGLLAKADCCVIATDPGREGEHIGRTILTACGYKGKLLRLWIDDLTPATIQAGFRQLKDGAETENLAASATVRAYADYWMGFTATRFFTLVAQEVTGEKMVLSAGRVQTPTLRIVYDRERSIDQFTSQPFYVLMADMLAKTGSYKAQWFRDDAEGRITRFNSIDNAEAIRKKLIGQTGIVTHYEEKQAKRQAPQLLHSTSIKTAARKELGFSIDKTVKVLQKIYDDGYVTYPRTSSRHLSENAADKLAADLAAIRAESKYKQLFPDEIRSLKGKTRFVDDTKATEHHAIVPTGANPTGLTEDEEKLYALILRYTLAAHHPEGLDKEIEVITTVADETFYTKSATVLEAGWRRIMKPEVEEEGGGHELQTGQATKIPQLQQGDKATVQQTETHTGKTTPPKRLAADELEKAMEHAGKIVEDTAEDDEVLQLLKEKGIGTPATRTAIIQELAKREYIEMKKNLVYLTDKGRNFMELVYSLPLASIELTGEFEKKLAEVAGGLRSAADVLEEFKTFTQHILHTQDQLQQKLYSLKNDNKLSLFSNIVQIGECPLCEKPVIEGKKGYGCSGWREGCKFVIWKEFRGMKLREKQAKELLAGKEVLLHVTPSEEGKKAYDVFLYLSNGQLQTRFPTTEDQSIGDCPKCGSAVIEKEKIYGCSGYKDGCKFAIWKTFRGVAVPRKAVKPLLTGKEFLLQDIPPSSEGKKPYDLLIYLKDGEMQTRFPTAEDRSIGLCPLCGKPILEGESSYSCSSWREGCKFKLSKQFLGVTIPVTQMKKLLKQGETDKLQGFKGGKTGQFDTALGYDKSQNRYSFVKESRQKK